MRSSAELALSHGLYPERRGDDDGIGEDGREGISGPAGRAPSAALVCSSHPGGVEDDTPVLEVAGQVEAGQPNMLSMDACAGYCKYLAAMSSVMSTWKRRIAQRSLRKTG